MDDDPRRALAPGHSPYLTTVDAARYCGFKTSSAIRKAHHEGRLLPVGRRGGTGTWVWAVTDLDRFMRGEPPSPALLAFLLRNARVRLPHEVHMKKQKDWKLYKGSWISTEPVLPRVWQRTDGGHIVRARVIDRSTGREKEIWKVLANMDAPTALTWIEQECKRVRAGEVPATPRSMRFSSYVTSLFERKVATKEIKSASGRERWRYTLSHLIAGTKSVAGFGDLFIDEIRPMHVETWGAGIGKLIAQGTYSPTTANASRDRARMAASASVSWPAAGTDPMLRAANETERLTRLPQVATSSSLLRRTNSRQVKSVS